ncbi:unnamed protein product, partial [Mesorhabditis spiculigera]
MYIALQLFYIIDLDITSQSLTAYAQVEFNWTDPRLRWDPEDYGGVELIYVECQTLWIPAETLSTSLSTTRTNTEQRYACRVQSNGSVEYLLSVKVELLCFVNGNGEWAIQNVTVVDNLVTGADEGLRVTMLSIALTSMMSMTTFVNIISQQIPKTASFPLLGIFVLVCVFITSASCVDVSRQSLMAYAQIELNWTDPRLTWDPEDYGGVELIYVDSDYLWIPAEILGSSLSTKKTNKDQRYPCRVQSNGSVEYVLAVRMELYCIMDIQLFPFDTQICELSFIPYGYDDNQITAYGLLFTNMMSMTTFVDMISQQMPKTSSFPLLGIFVLACVFITSLSCVVLVLFTEHINVKEQPTGTWKERLMRFVFAKHFGFFIVFQGCNIANFIDALRQIMEAYAQIAMFWVDPRLTWDPVEYGDVEEIFVDCDYFWIPSEILSSSLTTQQTTKEYKLPCRLLSNGTVENMLNVKLELACMMDIQLFPFDTQFCELGFIPYGYTTDRVKVQGSMFEQYEGGRSLMGNGEWQIINVSQISMMVPGERHGQVEMLSYIIKCKRQPDFYIYVILSIALTSMMSMTTFVNMISQQMPKTASFPLLGIFVLDCVFLISVACVALVLFTEHIGIKEKPVGLNEQNKSFVRDSNRLFAALFKDYYKELAAINTGNESDVELDPFELDPELQLLYIINLDAMRQVMDAYAQIGMSWIDPRLTWDPSDYGGIPEIYVDCDYFWIPSEIMSSSLSAKKTSKEYQYPCHLKANGTVEYVLTVRMELACMMEIKLFPFDTQNCALGFVPHGYGKGMITVHGSMFETFNENGSALLSIALTSMMSMTTFVNMISQQMPKTASFPLLGIFVLVCVFIISVACVVLVLFTEHINLKEKPNGNSQNLSDGFDYDVTTDLGEPNVFYNNLNRISDALFNNYRSKIAPIENGSFNVRLILQLLYIIDLDVSRQTAEIYVETDTAWLDPRLSWDPRNYGGIDFVYVDCDEIWVPLVGFSSSLSAARVNPNRVDQCRILANGSVSYTQSTCNELVCPMDIGNFPFDSQTCMLSFSSSSYDGTNLTLSGTLFSRYKQELSNMGSGEWTITDIHKAVDEWPVNNEDAWASHQLVFKFSCSRQPAFYFNVIALPCFLLTFLSITGCFWTPNVKSEQLVKLSIALTSMMSMTTFVDMISQQMPKTDTFPLLGIFVLTCVFIISFGCVALVLFPETLKHDVCKKQEL